MLKEIDGDDHGENGDGESENLNNAFADLEAPKENQA